MMATVPHVTSGLGLRKFQADGFLLTRVCNLGSVATALGSVNCKTKRNLNLWHTYISYSYNSSSSILILFGSGNQNLYETYQCRIYSRKLLMMGRENVRNM